MIPWWYLIIAYVVGQMTGIVTMAILRGGENKDR